MPFRPSRFSSAHIAATFLVGFLATLLVGCGQGGEASAADQASPSVKRVGYLEIEPTTIGRTERLPGRVVAYKTAEIRPQVSGIIQSRLFDEGSYVEEGQKLYQIDPARYDADLQLAQASLQDAKARQKNAQISVDRFAKLIQGSAVSQQQYDDAMAALNQAEAMVGMAEAEVRIAQINLDYTSVHSPISGYISPSNVTKGALVTARQEAPLATVRQLDPVYVDLAQTASESRSLQSRLRASRQSNSGDPEFSVTLFLRNSDETYPETGRLNATDLAVDLQTGAIRLRAKFANPETILLPGMFVRASIEDVGRAKAIMVPQKSVSIGEDGEKTVWIVDSEDKARQRSIQTGASHANHWIVVDGLEAGERVIVEGSMGLSEGDPVEAARINPAS